MKSWMMRDMWYEENANGISVKNHEKKNPPPPVGDLRAVGTITPQWTIQKRDMWMS
jgi:hypothetical protein